MESAPDIRGRGTLMLLLMLLLLIGLILAVTLTSSHRPTGPLI